MKVIAAILFSMIVAACSGSGFNIPNNDDCSVPNNPNCAIGGSSGGDAAGE